MLPLKEMQTIKELNLTDKPSIDRILANLQPEVSDLTFTNIFMWQYSYGLRVFYDETLDYWFLLAKPSRWRPFFLPLIGDWSDEDKLRKALRIMDNLMKEENSDLLLRRIPWRLGEAFRRIDPCLILKEERNTFDYLYRSRDLISLAGRKYHSKRNHLSQFQRKYRWEYLRITTEIIKECTKLETEWLNLKTFETAPNSEELAIALVLNNFNTLGVVGGVIKVEGEIQALAVGERLNEKTAVIHIEKANTNFEGIYATINQQFAADQWGNFELINREEDMGIEGLRKAKLSYHPTELIEKFSVSRKA